MPALTIDGKKVIVPEGATVLQAVRAAEADLPTLCRHEELAPYGACRLCMVSIVSPRSALVASCIHPVEDGMVVETRSPDAVNARRLALEFLLGRAPNSEYIRELAAREGVTRSRFADPAASEGKADDLCVLCGLCVRVCRNVVGASALCMVGRGVDRRVSTPFDMQSDDCTGCAACAEVCPTGAIRVEDRGGRRILHTWNTSVELAKCGECGRSYAPRAAASLKEPLQETKEKLPEAQDAPDLCPDCRKLR